MNTPDVTDVLQRFLALDADFSALSLELRPASEDYGEVFIGSAADAAKTVYEPAWSTGLLVIRAPRAHDVSVWSATTEQLRDGTDDTARAFGPEWREAATHLVPGRRFFAFRFVDGGGSPVGEGDGLTLVGGRWRWFPNPAVAVRGRETASAPSARAGAGVTPLRTRSAPGLDVLAVAADRTARDALLADAALAPIVGQQDVRTWTSRVRRAYLEHGVRITRTAAPAIFHVIDAVCERLELATEVEVYTGADLQGIGPAGVPPALDGKVSLFLAPFVIDHFEPAELAFVVGHELGHVVLDHHLLHPSCIEGRSEIPLTLTARLFSWQRYAELSADRIGLVCCDAFDIAVRAMFKLTSGLERADFANAQDLLAQQRDLDAQGRNPQAQHLTQPWSPLRLTALDLFARSCLFHRVQGRQDGELTDADLEREIAELMSFMDPPPVGSTEDDAIQRFLAFAGYWIIRSDVTVKQLQALDRLAGTHVREVLRAWNAGSEVYTKALFAAGNAVVLLVPVGRRIKIIEDLVSLALVHEGISQAEMRILVTFPGLLKLESSVLLEAVARLKNPLD